MKISKCDSFLYDTVRIRAMSYDSDTGYFDYGLRKVAFKQAIKQIDKKRTDLRKCQQ